MKKLKVANTQALKDTIVAVSFAAAAGDISLIYGEAGLGKTVALKEYVKKYPKTIYIELKDCDRTTKGVCERILTYVGKESHGTDRFLVDTIIEYLDKNPRLIIIDEAQHLSVRAIENIRAINDVTESGIVLCGNPTIYNRMHGKGQAHFAQLYSRIGIKRNILEPSINDISEIFKDYSLDKESIKYLYTMSLDYGGIRNCVKVFNIALQVKRDEKEPLSIEHLRSASKLRNGEQ